MDEQFLYDFRTGCGNSAKFARIFDMGFTYEHNYVPVFFKRELLHFTYTIMNCNFRPPPGYQLPSFDDPLPLMMLLFVHNALKILMQKVCFTIVISKYQFSTFQPCTKGISLLFYDNTKIFI